MLKSGGFKEKDAYIDYEPQQLIMYVEKEDGTFGPIQTGSYITKNYLDDFWEKMLKLKNSLLEQLKKNEITPIYFYKLIHDFNDEGKIIRDNAYYSQSMMTAK